jgi:hypothetical protein
VGLGSPLAKKKSFFTIIISSVVELAYICCGLQETTRMHQICPSSWLRSQFADELRDTCREHGCLKTINTLFLPLPQVRTQRTIVCSHLTHSWCRAGIPLPFVEGLSLPAIPNFGFLGYRGFYRTAHLLPLQSSSSEPSTVLATQT